MEDVLATLGGDDRPTGASGGHFGRLWAEKGEPKNCMDGSWGRLGALLAALGGPGSLEEDILELFYLGKNGKNYLKK